MEYFIGVALAVGVGLLTTFAGFDRDRSLYPVIVMVTASYYDLFAVLGGGASLGAEVFGFALFFVAALLAFRVSLWIGVAALWGHGLFDLLHDRLIENPGVPAWWPMFCLSFDVAAGAYLAVRLLSKSIDARTPSGFGKQIRRCVEAELAAAKAAELEGDPQAAFRRLERAHVLGQNSTVQHVRVHMHMLAWGVRNHDSREVVGQVLRVLGAAAGTWAGLVPQGNTGGANVSGLKPMAIPDDLALLIAAARAAAGEA